MGSEKRWGKFRAVKVGFPNLCKNHKHASTIPIPVQQCTKGEVIQGGGFFTQEGYALDPHVVGFGIDSGSSYQITIRQCIECAIAAFGCYGVHWAAGRY